MSIPRICSRDFASSGVLATLTPPALPRPPVLTWALTTVTPPDLAPISSAAARASSGWWRWRLPEPERRAPRTCRGLGTRRDPRVSPSSSSMRSVPRTLDPCGLPPEPGNVPTGTKIPATDLSDRAVAGRPQPPGQWRPGLRSRLVTTSAEAVPLGSLHRLPLPPWRARVGRPAPPPRVRVAPSHATVTTATGSPESASAAGRNRSS